MKEKMARRLFLKVIQINGKLLLSVNTGYNVKNLDIIVTG